MDTGVKEPMKFLRLSYIETYNNEMGDVDIADQYQNTYTFDHWMCERKWWRAILFWDIGVILVNAYIVYVRVCKPEDVEEKIYYLIMISE